MQLCSKAPSFAVKIVDLILKERIPVVSGPAKVSLIYLVNDLIQRSKIRQKTPPFYELFRPMLEETLVQILGLNAEKLEAQQKLEILKVVEVWR